MTIHGDLIIIKLSNVILELKDKKMKYFIKLKIRFFGRLMDGSIGRREYGKLSDSTSLTNCL
jgi:hypothetical protein